MPTLQLDPLRKLIADGKIPPMVHLMIAPGMVGERRMRSIEYDTVNLDYTRFVLEEILPEADEGPLVAAGHGVGEEQQRFAARIQDQDAGRLAVRVRNVPERAPSDWEEQRRTGAARVRLLEQVHGEA